jgi:hypothetical protein
MRDEDSGVETAGVVEDEEMPACFNTITVSAAMY